MIWHFPKFELPSAGINGYNWPEIITWVERGATDFPALVDGGCT